MTKLFLAAGVAALAITAPASAGPGGQGGQAGKENRVERVKSSGGDRRAARQAAVEQRAARPARAERSAARVERRAARVDRVQSRPQRVEARRNAVQRVDNRAARGEARQVNRLQRVENRALMADNRRAQHIQRVERRMDSRANRAFANNFGNPRARGLIDGCPPGLAKRGNGCLPPGQAMKLGLSPLVTAQTASMLRTAQVDGLNRRLGYRLAAPATAASLLGLPLTQANAILPLAPVPSSISYLYPSNAMYDYRYNDGYVYQVDKTSNLIAALIPLLAGGYLPGQMLPSSYMNSYVPNNYGYNSFYPSYQNQCTRYANGVVYYVDCGTGLIENVMPLYDSGYGVGQMLPSSYSYYNVPDQYRPYYYNTANTGYWYAPGAIYQYDPTSSLITSVAALLSPGLTVGQPLPTGYGAYNVPLGFRDTYYDSPTANYRYANGYIYQVDPVTQLVTAVVASALS